MRAVIAIATVALAALAINCDRLRPSRCTGARVTDSAPALKVARAVVSQSEDGPAIRNGAAFQPGDMAVFQLSGGELQTWARPARCSSPDISRHSTRTGRPSSPRDEEVIGTTVSEEDKDWKPKLRLADSDPFHCAAGKLQDQIRSRRPADPSDRFGRNGLSRRRAKAWNRRRAHHSQSGFLSHRRTTRRRSRPWPIGRATCSGCASMSPATSTANRIRSTSRTTWRCWRPTANNCSRRKMRRSEKSQAFYPQPWVPAAFNLSLQSTMRAGAYTLVITAHDGVGKQTAVERSGIQGRIKNFWPSHLV